MNKNTKLKQIQCWANYYPENYFTVSTYKEKPTSVGPGGITVPCTIMLEMPVEEKKVTITESDYDKAFDEWNNFRGIDNVGMQQFIKEKLFGGG